MLVQHCILFDGVRLLTVSNDLSHHQFISDSKTPAEGKKCAGIGIVAP
jgi:hypothetical protein